jgi:NAD(P)-dependent dehydrogenase (short-subunit alcohol dehydrogenase family)
MTMRTIDLGGSVALVTGAQQGIGRAAAAALASAGADVAVNYLDNEEDAHLTANACGAHGRKAVIVQGDVSRREDAERMVAECVDALGRIDILVNNAGVFPRVKFVDMTDAEWDYLIDINLKGGFLCAQAAARQMIAAGHGGSIVNLSSGALRGVKLGVHYSASKGGVVSMTRAMALELAPHGIRVNAVAPGLTDTAQPRYEHSDEELHALGRALPLGRVGTPAEIADAITFLVSPMASFITGQILHVNGGGYMP